MKASCSLWSADLLALKNAIEALSGHADEFHVDVMDGTCVPDILFGLDFVAAMRGITETPLDVHLMTHTSVDLIDRAVASGAAARIRMLTGLRDRLGVKFEIFVDGGIRPDTVPLLAAAGADGIVPGSLVFKAADPVAALNWIHSLQHHQLQRES